MIDEIIFQSALIESDRLKRYLEAKIEELNKNPSSTEPVKLFHLIRGLSPLEQQILKHEFKNEFGNLLLKLNSGFIYFKLSPVRSNFIKLHIPLNDYWKDGIFISNLLTSKIDTFTALKFVLPVKYNSFDDLTPEYQRGLTQIPITIYLPKPTGRLIPVAIPEDEKLLNIEEIAFTIHQIDILLDEVATMPIDDEGNTYGEIRLSENIADTDRRIGKYTTLSLDYDCANNYISAYERYVHIGEGIYAQITEVPGTMVMNSLSGAEVRQRLMRESLEIEYLEKVLPYAKIFNDLNSYINFRKLTNTRPSIFNSGATPEESLLNTMRYILFGDPDINTELENIYPRIRNNPYLRKIMTQFREKHAELQEYRNLEFTLR